MGGANFTHLKNGEWAWEVAVSSRYSALRGNPLFGNVFPPAFRVFRLNETLANTLDQTADTFADKSRLRLSHDAPRFVLEDYRQRVPLGRYGVFTWIPPRPELHLESFYGADFLTTVRFHRLAASSLYDADSSAFSGSKKTKEYAAVLASLT